MSVIALVMVIPPKPPGSRQLISPPAAVLEIAPGKVLQGAVRLHGLTSSPTPEIQVRVACACAGATHITVKSTATRTPLNLEILDISASLLGRATNAPSAQSHKMHASGGHAWRLH